MSRWGDIFDAHAVKRVSPNDQRKCAYVPSREQKTVLEKAGWLPTDGGPAPATSVRVLGDPQRSTVDASYYRSRGHPGREPRLGRQVISSWLVEGDELLMGLKAGQLFFAKVHDPATHTQIASDLQRTAGNPATTSGSTRVNPRADDGRVLRAQFSVDGQPPDFTIIMECGDGRRHTEYAPALELILARLASLEARLLSARLATAVALKRAEEEQLDTSLRPAGFELPLTIRASEVSKLRKALGNAGAAIGKPANTSGNSTKRMALVVQLGLTVSSASELLALLADGLDGRITEPLELDREDVRTLTADAGPTELERLRQKYADAAPEVKSRLSHHIERGSVGERVKRGRVVIAVRSVKRWGATDWVSRSGWEGITSKPTMFCLYQGLWRAHWILPT